jgi:hypothetical protein
MLCAPTPLGGTPSAEVGEVIYDYWLVFLLGNIFGILFEFHPIIVLGGVLVSMLIKIIIDLLEFEFSEEEE